MNYINQKINTIALKEFKGNNSKFAEFMDTSEANIRNYRSKTLPKLDFIVKLHTKLEISYDWLFSGLYENDDKTYLLTDDIPIEYKKSPLVPLYDTIHKTEESKKVTSEDEHFKNISPVAFINAGDWFPAATATFRYYGNHMKEYPNGCVLALKEIDESKAIVWGHNYAVLTDEGFFIKRIQKADEANTIVAYSSNEDRSADGNLIYEPIKISTDRILRYYEVLGYVVK